jgi:hypothetical protein
MSEYDIVKSQFIQDLWLPCVRKGGDYFFPRKRKNKELNVFTLTTDTNSQEISSFIKNGLTKQGNIFAWTHSHIKRMRLETEFSDVNVLGLSKYETSIANPNFLLKNHFPFHVINLDYLCQEPRCEPGRLEKELIGIERTISFQRDRMSECILIFTTLLNGNNMNLQTICDESDGIRMPHWRGLLNDDRDKAIPISDNQQKIVILNEILTALSGKYFYSIDLRTKSISLSDGAIAYSVVAILKERVNHAIN